MPDLFAVLRRRWYLVVVGILVTALAALGAKQVTPRYLASEVVVMQPPVSPYAPNPMTGLYPSISITGAAVAQRLSAPDAEARLRAAGVTGPYAFQPRNTGTNQEPRYVIGSMTVTTIASDEESGLRALAALRAAFEQELTRLQDRWRVARQLRITIAVLVPPSATLLPHSSSRALAGAGLLGMVATLAVTLWADELLARRRRSRPRQPVAAAG
ncbi:hypothetical protein ACL02O_31240 [Micromonospora sp. MS34]|uniref:hypothetical protein n=1 Tax=Micromonospora sp. MS34 TaxID=3385971 RepID=UPI0039A0CB69